MGAHGASLWGRSALVFPQQLAVNTKSVAEAISHEVGGRVGRQWGRMALHGAATRCMGLCTGCMRSKTRAKDSSLALSTPITSSPAAHTHGSGGSDAVAKLKNLSTVYTPTQVGHRLGLSHDGIAGVTQYSQGTGNWAPIMGARWVPSASCTICVGVGVGLECGCACVCSQGGCPAACRMLLAAALTLQAVQQLNRCWLLAPLLLLKTQSEHALVQAMPCPTQTHTACTRTNARAATETHTNTCSYTRTHTRTATTQT